MLRSCPGDELQKDHSSRKEEKAPRNSAKGRVAEGGGGGQESCGPSRRGGPGWAMLALCKPTVL